MFIRTYSTGACQVGTGPMGIGGALYDKYGMEIVTVIEAKGEGTAIEAEYLALIRTLEIAQDYPATRVECHLSSELVAMQINGECAVRQESIAQLYQEVIDLLLSFKDGFAVTYVPFHQNAWSAKLAQFAIETRFIDRRREGARPCTSSQSIVI